MKNIQIKQKMFELDIDDKKNTNLASILSEMLLYERDYENDEVLVHQVLNLSRIGEMPTKFLVICNITRDLNNLGGKISY
jgi:hypothetical protein